MIDDRRFIINACSVLNKIENEIYVPAARFLHKKKVIAQITSPIHEGMPDSEEARLIYRRIMLS